jgi:hypothetical protein
MTTIDQFLEGLAAQLGRPLAPSDVTPADIANAEKALGVQLPPSYRQLITSCTWEDVPHTMYWLGRDLPPAHDLLHIKRTTPLPPFLVPLCGNGGGNEFCFDTRRTDASGEHPLVEWNHEIHAEHSTEFEQIAPDLGAFLLILL